jgi:hypothetical protein
MKTRYFVGIDIGKNGGICIQDVETGEIIKSVMPIIGKEFDIHSFVAILKPFKDTDCMVAFEDLRAIHSASAGATFTFGHIAGATEAAVISLGLPYRKVNAKVWQKQAFAGIPEIRKPDVTDKNGKIKKGAIDTKAMALIASKRLYPNVDTRPTERSKNPHDGIVDALLINWWVIQNYK